MALQSNYKYSNHPKPGDHVTIIDGYDPDEKLVGRTGTVLPGKCKQGRTYFVNVVGIGVHSFHIKSLFNLNL